MSRKSAFIKDAKVNNAAASDTQVLPPFDSNHPSPNLISGTGGGIAYDLVTRRVYYNDGFQWIPLLSSASILSASSFSYFLGTSQTIAPTTFTILSGWSDAISPPYHDDTAGWNPVTGIFTAAGSVPQDLDITANISWGTGSNLGERTLSIIYQPVVGPSVTVANFTTQANPSNAIQTPQTIRAVVKMTSVGDQAWIQVEHNYTLPIAIIGGANTTMCGVKFG